MKIILDQQFAKYTNTNETSKLNTTKSKTGNRGNTEGKLWKHPRKP